MDITEIAVFNNFCAISRIPRESGSERAVSDYIESRARGLGLEVIQDGLYNLIIKKPASDGREGREPLMLQAHLDMVCEKAPDSDHDFSKDPIVPVVDGDWLRAESTSLGADNGIGVAAAMSLLEDPDLRHPPLEVVFTVREETDFAGAKEIDKALLSSKRMINLDHACENEVVTGSCGGCGIKFELPVSRSGSVLSDSSGARAYSLSVQGLQGGHSGEDIHRGRGNAILLAIRLAERTGCPIIGIDGGTSRLAIPRDACVAVISDDKSALLDAADKACEEFRNEYPGAADLRVVVKECETELQPLDADSTKRLCSVLRLYPDGIVRMFDNMECIVESSDNIGIIRTAGDSVQIVSEVRGGYRSTIDDIAARIDRLALLTGARTERFAEYAPWSSSPDSPLREMAVSTYKNVHGDRMYPIAVHAGLECSFFAVSDPDLDIISVGPDCRDFHSPDERVSISSVIRFYEFLSALISRL